MEVLLAATLVTHLWRRWLNVEDFTTDTNVLLTSQTAVRAAPSLVPRAIIAICGTYNEDTKMACTEWYNNTTIGAVWSHLFSARVLGFQDSTVLASGADWSYSTGGLLASRRVQENGKYIAHHLPQHLQVLPLQGNTSFEFPHWSAIHGWLGGRLLRLHVLSDKQSQQTGIKGESQKEISTCTLMWLITMRYDTPYSLASSALQSVGPSMARRKKIRLFLPYILQTSWFTILIHIGHAQLSLTPNQASM